MSVFRTSACFFLLDQLTKIAAQRLLDIPIPVIPNIFHLTLVHNTGGAFGLLKGQALFFIAVGAGSIMFIFMVRRSIQQASGGLRWAVALILAGAAGNLVDRIRFGYVIDFLDFRVWPVFNVADSCITIGSGILIWHLLKKSTRAREH